MKSMCKKTIEGDVESFNELVQRHHTRIYGLAYRMLSNPEDAADATQEAFLEAYKSIKIVPIPIEVFDVVVPSRYQYVPTIHPQI